MKGTHSFHSRGLLELSAETSGPLKAPCLSELFRSCGSRAGIRVALVNPQQTFPSRLADDYQSYIPLGLASLAAVLERTGAQVKVIDALAYDTVERRGDETIFGLASHQLRRELAAFAPHVVGVTNPFSAFLADALDVTRWVKSVDPTIQVVFGGIEPSLDARNLDLLRANPTIDVIVRGEGEATICELIAHYDPRTRRFESLESVAGLVIRTEAGPVVRTAARPFIRNLDELPLPAYHLLEMDRMFANPYYARYRAPHDSGRSLPVHSTRGCPYSCCFCSVHSQVGKAHRAHSPEYVRTHIRHLIDTYGVRHIQFEDDNLTLQPVRSLALLRAIEDLGITWHTPNGLRADTITEELARSMRSSGAISATIAVESGDQRILDRVIHKRLRLPAVIEAAETLARFDIPTIMFFVIGFPGETEVEVRRTLEFAKRMALEHGTINFLFVATPLPDTELERECRAKGYLTAALDNTGLLSGIRLNESSLITTADFDKRQLFSWAKDVLDVPEIRTLGEHIPFFFASSPAGLRNATRFLGSPPEEPRVSYWRKRPNRPQRGQDRDQGGTAHERPSSF